MSLFSPFWVFSPCACFIPTTSIFLCYGFLQIVLSQTVVVGLEWKIMSQFPEFPKKSNAKECSNYCTIALISKAIKVILKILQARLQQYMNHKLPEFKQVLEKAEEPEIKLPKSAGSSKKQESSRKTSLSLDHQKSKRVPEKHLFLLYGLCQSLWLCGSQ